MAIAIDASTPAYAGTEDTASTSLTTNSFTPPAGSLVVLIYNSAGSQGNVNPTISDSLGTHLNWTQLVAQKSTNGGVQIFIGDVVTSTAMTATASFTSSDFVDLIPVVVTGAAPVASQIGATASNGSASGNPSATIASLVGNDSLVIGGINNNTTGVQPVPSGQSRIINGNDTWDVNDGTWFQYLTGMDLSAGSSATINIVATGIQFGIAIAEILAASVGSTQTIEPTSDITTTGWTPSTGSTLYGVVGDDSDSDWASAILSASLSSPIQAATTNPSASTSFTITLGNEVAVGDALILCASNFATGADAITAVSGGGVTWEKAVADTLSPNANATVEIWYGLDSSGGGGTETITVTCSLFGNGGVASVTEWPALASFDKANSTSSGGPGATATTPSITTAGNGELVIAMCVNAGGSTTAATTPFTTIDAFFTDSSGFAQAVYDVQSTAGSISTSWPVTFQFWTTAIAAFTP